MTETKKQQEPKNEQTELLDKLTKSQTKQIIEWEDNDGKKQSKEITLKQPSTRISMRIRDLMMAEQASMDFASIFELLMDNVIVNPRLTYVDLNHNLPEDLRYKTVDYKNVDGKDVTVKYVFPTFREAITESTSAQKANQSLNMVGAMDLMLDSGVIRHKDGTKLSWDDFDNDYDGLIDDIFGDSQDFLTEGLANDGVMATLFASFRLSQDRLSKVR